MPAFFPKTLYKARARIEQAVGKLKRFKRIALRCEKTAQNYGSFVALALGFNPDNKSEAIFFRLDRNGDGRADVIVFDFKRRGKWDLSFWDEQFDGHWTLVGFHDDGSLKPTRFESYAEFQNRLAAQR